MKKKIFFCTLLCAILQVNAQMIIFNETFETDSPTVNGWAHYSLDGGLINWQLTDESSTTNPWGFSGQVYESFSSFGSPDNVLNSPDITLPSNGNLSLSYQIGSSSLVAPAEHYAVYILPAGSSFTGSETPVFEETLATAHMAITRTVDIASNAGQDINIYFRHFDCTQNTIILDNVKITQGTLGTLETVRDVNVGIYPNPTTDYLTIKSKAKILNSDIYDFSGKKINANLKDNKVDVRNLESGNYIIKIETKDGVKTEKFIKK